MINNKDKFTEIETWLYNYKSIKVAIENLKLELDSLDGDLCSKSTGERSVTNRVNSDVENFVCKKEFLRKRINTMEMRIIQIERAMAILNNDESKVIYNFYINGKRYYEFAYEIGYSERNCKRIKKKALYKIVLCLIGE